MTSEEFNALPLDARRYIEDKQGCQSCGGSSQDIDTIYKKYLIMKQGTLFTLRTGAVNFKSADGKKTGILYPIHPNDTDEVVKEKLEAALEVHAVAPEKFESISEEKIKKVLEAKTESKEPKADGPKDKNGKLLIGAPLKAFLKAEADKKTKEEADAKKEADAKSDTPDENLD